MIIHLILFYLTNVEHFQPPYQDVTEVTDFVHNWALMKHLYLLIIW